MKRFLWLLAIPAALILCSCASRPPLQTVKQVDLKRYSGKWYEQGRYPNWFQRKCAGKVTAEYTPNPDGSITVVNSCVRRDGQLEQVRGRATVVKGSHGTRLAVSFGGPFTGAYWIIGLDPDYRWALVGHPSRRFLWILSRDEHLSAADYRRAVGLAVRQGYDAERIIRTPH